MKYPSVTFIIPTLNAEKNLEKCLASIAKQDYPRDRFEVFVVDGESTDRTREIAKKYNFRVIDNPKVDPESGKALGIKESMGEIIALLDSDNEIINRDWLKKMTFPIADNPNLFGVESEYFPKKGESIFNTYCMVIHIADPFSRMLAARLVKVRKKEYEEFTIPEGQSYPLGANGFLWNKKIINKIGLKSMFEESNFSFFVMQKGFRTFARVPGYGIYHYHISSFWGFVAKRLKIGGKFLNRKKEKKRTWLEGVSPFKFVYSVFFCLTFVGPFFESVWNLIKTRQSAWLLHPLMSFVSVLTYVYVYLKRYFRA